MVATAQGLMALITFYPFCFDERATLTRSKDFLPFFYSFRCGAYHPFFQNFKILLIFYVTLIDSNALSKNNPITYQFPPRLSSEIILVYSKTPYHAICYKFCCLDKGTNLFFISSTELQVIHQDKMVDPRSVHSR